MHVIFEICYVKAKYRYGYSTADRVFISLREIYIKRVTDPSNKRKQTPYKILRRYLPHPKHSLFSILAVSTQVGCA